MLHDEFLYFIRNQDELVKRYPGQFIVIKDQKVVSQHASRLEAYVEAQKAYPLGTFLIQKCEPGQSAYTIILQPQLAPA